MQMQPIVKRLTFIMTLTLCFGFMLSGGRAVSANSSYQAHTKHWVWPVSGEITDTFGSRHGRHKGLDIAAPLGEATFSVDEGIVKKSYYSTTYGNVVFIEHPNGLETVYAHLSKRNVNVGEKVTHGQKIGEIGSTGVSTGSHLHFEVHKGEWTYEKNNAIDPLSVLKQSNLLASKNVGDNNGTKTKKTHGETDSIEVSNQPNRSEEKVIEVTVKKDQTLWHLAKKYNVSINSIMDANALDSSLLEIGQVLIIPATYIVEAGDTLTDISEETGISVEKIVKLNQLNGDVIFPQQELILQ